ncbi:preprotein translocase subunit SecE [Gemella haemolysans]|uniref:Protein translocase subunit SecE n=1 Tax=Gemella haemolysans TaxID=1379 RepID=A0AAW6AZX6_9BACL|nr:preprotein translocase subunit SecE [Gemella haemolysans]MDB6185507.1 preprotein translocase subunit SecE [Gemella haemolysans]
MIRFLKNVAAEMRKVSWPTFNELVRKTLIVIVVVGILMLFSYVVDLGITAGIRHFSR